MTTEDDKSGNWGWRCRPWWFLFPVLGAAAIFVFGTVVMYLWNAVIPSVFTSLGPITFWQAIGLLVLSKILFGGFKRGWGGRCGCHGGWRGRHRGMYWKEKWMNMSEEERAKFKEEWKNRCGPSTC